MLAWADDVSFLRTLLSLTFFGVGCAPLEGDVAVSEHEITVCGHGPTVEGIDVSSWQGAIDWDAVGRSGIGFAIVRIGDGTYRDSRFRENWDGAGRVGLLRGAYLFFEPDIDPDVQADIVVAAVGRLGPGDLPVTIDVEAPGPGVSPAEYTRRIHRWVDRVTAGTGREPIVYTGRYYWDPFVASSDFRHLPLWHAQYTSAACPNINDRWSDWTFWQYTSSGSIAGIGGRVDRNRFNGTLAELRAMATVARDDDGDGSVAGIDCDDHDPRRFPGRVEECDGHENDCDGAVDENLSRRCGSDVGECVAGTSTCRVGTWGGCEGSVDPVPEACDELDNDCDGENDDEQICEREEAMFGASIVASAAETDVDGDGDADACARTDAGFSCLRSGPHGFGDVVPGPSLGEATWSDVTHAATLRMADVDGDGRADVCGYDGEALHCWRSSGTTLTEPLETVPLGAGVTSVELADVDGDARLDLCARDARGLHCHLATGHGFGHLVELPALSDAAGFSNVVHHGSLRLGDVDGDGRADVCARDASGLDCWLSLGDHFGDRVRGPRWSDGAGLETLPYWSTLRLVDVDGDARADVCLRTPAGFRCALSLGVGFADELVGPAMDAAAGWDRRDVYTTIRMADVDGDGAADVCARETDRVRCWLFTGHGFDRVVLGPVLPEADGWTAPGRFRSIRLADVDGDARADLCGRTDDGLSCWVSSAAPFDRVFLAPSWSDETGLGSTTNLATIRVAGGGTRATAASASAALTGACSAHPGGGRPSSALLFGLALVAVAVCGRRAR